MQVSPSSPVLSRTSPEHRDWKQKVHDSLQRSFSGELAHDKPVSPSSIVAYMTLTRKGSSSPVLIRQHRLSRASSEDEGTVSTSSNKNK